MRLKVKCFFFITYFSLVLELVKLHQRVSVSEYTKETGLHLWAGLLQWWMMWARLL